MGLKKAKRVFLFRIKGVMLFLAFLSIIISGKVPAALAAGMALTVQPKQIDVGLDFAGQTVDISGTVPPGSDILIKLVSPARNVNLTRKGKVGFLWMNVAQAEVEGVPKMYQVYSSEKVASLPADIQRETGIDQNFTAVRNACTIKEISNNQTRILTGEEGKKYFDALVELYRKNNLYVIKENAVQVSGNRFQASVPLPATVAFGNIQVFAYAVDVRNGKILGKEESNFVVRPVGLVGRERTMAKMNGPLYGMLAIYIALAAGLLIDILFNYLNKIFRLAGKAPSTRKHSQEAIETH